MGFLRNLIGYAAEGIGKLIGSEKIQDWGRNFRGASEAVSSSVSKYDSYDRETATVSETEDLSAALSKFSTEYRDQASDIEDNMLDIVEEYFDKITDDLSAKGFETGFIKAEIKLVKKTIRHSITNSLSVRLTLSDPDCRRILELKKGSHKKKKMEAFCAEIVNDAIYELVSNLKYSFKAIEYKIKDAVDSKLEENEKELAIEKDRLVNLIAQHDSQTFDVEKNEVQPYKNICTCLCIFDILKLAE